LDADFSTKARKHAFLMLILVLSFCGVEAPTKKYLRFLLIIFSCKAAML
jgi:hypothetical protein